MKIITRSTHKNMDNSVIIFPDLTVNPDMTVKELFGPSGLICVSVEQVDRDQVKLGFNLPSAISLLEGEVIEPVTNSISAGKGVQV